MTTEFARRDRLMDKCLDLANLSFEQGDLQTGELMLRKSLELLGINMQAMELMQPGFTASLKDNPEWVRLAQILGGIQK